MPVVLTFSRGRARARAVFLFLLPPTATDGVSSRVRGVSKDRGVRRTDGRGEGGRNGRAQQVRRRYAIIVVIITARMLENRAKNKTNNETVFFFAFSFFLLCTFVCFFLRPTAG